MVDQLHFDWLDRSPEEMLEEFQEKFQTPNTPEFWETLVREEFKEVQKAMAELLKEFADLEYVTIGYENAGGDAMALTDALDPSDLIGDVSYAIDTDTFTAAFTRVHLNNMSKVHPDGTVRRREDGKVLKPTGYVPVDLIDLVK